MLDDAASVFLPMHPWFCAMVILNEDKLCDHCVVNFQQSCKHVDQAHKHWSKEHTESDHLHCHHWTEQESDDLVADDQVKSCKDFKKRVKNL